jgi:ABC-2 type transport system ATP-binding protein
LVALDSPLKLKASVPGKNIVEVSFTGATAQWRETLRTLPDVAEVEAKENLFRISTENGPRTTIALMEAARGANIAITSLSVQSTTLDDVFVHFTGRQMRDSLQSASAAESPYLFKR